MRLLHRHPYRVLRGGMSLVYLCEVSGEERKTHQKEAIKRLQPEFLSNPGTAERFLRECFLWLLLGDHPNVTKAISAHAVQHEPPFLVLEYLPHSLRDFLRSTPVELGMVLRVLIGITDGLSHAREVLPGFTHADLKPENVLIDEAGRPKITDLGLTRALIGQSIPVPPNLRHHGGPQSSAAPAGGGTPLYMAPEQIIEGARPESDLYALGCIAYELLTGKPVYGHPTTPADYLLRHLHQPAPDLTASHREVPHDLARLIAVLLAKTPQARPPLEEIGAILRHIAVANGIHVLRPILKPASLADRTNAAQGLQYLGFHADALRIGQQILQDSEIPADRVGALMIIAHAYTETGNSQEAAAALEDASPLIFAREDSVAKLVYYNHRLNLAHRTGDLATALRLSHEMIEAAPNSSVAYMNAGICHQQMGDLESAERCYLKALEIAGDFSYYARLIILYMMTGKEIRALQVCDEMVDFHPTLPDAYSLHGTTLATASSTGGPLAHIPRHEVYRILTQDLAAALRYGPPDLPLTADLAAIVAEFGK